jgi:hypothetical protein
MYAIQIEWCDGRGQTQVKFLGKDGKGTYVKVAPFHVFRYAHEQAFRFNHRLASDFGRFWLALSSVVGKRLTYRKLAALGDAGFMGIE